MLLVLLLIVTACGGGDSEEETKPTETETAETEDSNASEEQASGGELRVALSAQPSNLDQPMSTNTSTQDISRLIFETLLTIDENTEPIPMLAKSYDVSDDGLVYTFHLREGIKFHNGQEMTSEDVVASMERWLEVSTITGAVFEEAVFEAEDDYTVT